MERERRRVIEKGLRAGRRNVEIAADLGVSRERVRQLIAGDRLLRALGRVSARREARWQHATPDQANATTAGIVDWLTMHGVTVGQSEQGQRRCFRVGDRDFCVHYAATARATTGTTPYYHLTGCGLRRAYQVIVLGDGRRFIVPPGKLVARESHYIALKDDGGWAKYRDAWPFKVAPERTRRAS